MANIAAHASLGVRWIVKYQFRRMSGESGKYEIVFAGYYVMRGKNCKYVCFKEGGVGGLLVRYCVETVRSL